jgi:dUTP pyrophosphatase
MNLCKENPPVCITFIKTNTDAKMRRGSEYAAGYDVVNCEKNILIAPHCRELVNIGIRLESRINENQYIRIAPRSSLSMKGLDVSGGVIDSDFLGDIKVLLCNNSKEGIVVEKGEWIAQLIPEMISITAVSLNSKLIVGHRVRLDDGLGSSDETY